MSKATTAAEPSMEEILASIRRIIADEEPSARAPAAAAPPPLAVVPPTPEPEPPPPVAAAPAPVPADEDILDLAMAAAEAEQVAVAKPKPALVEPPEVPDVAFDEPPEPELPPMPAAPPPRAARPDPLREPVVPPRTPAPDPFADLDASESRADRLLSPGRDSEVAAAFGALSRAVFSNEPKTMEDLTKELLRPMLRAWLDDNLPPLVERLVREEIERVSRGRR